MKKKMTRTDKVIHAMSQWSCEEPFDEITKMLVEEWEAEETEIGFIKWCEIELT